MWLLTSPKYELDNLRRYFEEDNLFFLLIIIENSINWCDIEELYFSHLSEILNNSKGAEFKCPTKLNKDFDFVKIALGKYLLGLEFNNIQAYSDLFSDLNRRSTTILNFNYTPVIDKYVRKLNEINVIPIHGELNNEDNPIIFGYAADHNESRKLVESGDHEYARNIKKHCYKRTDNEDRLAKYLLDTEHIDVTILGHSCGFSDKLILNQIFIEDHVDNIQICYYNTYENYRQTAFNIDRIMNDNERFRLKVKNYTKSFRMPQYNDRDEDNIVFQNKITDFLNFQNEMLEASFI